VKELNYTKDRKTGAVIFNDVDAYAQRKKVIEKQKITKAVEKDSKKVINSLRNEINGLKQLLKGLIENQG